MSELEMKEQEYMNYIEEHISNVKTVFQKYGDRLSQELHINKFELERNIYKHDMSKFSDDEFNAYRNYYYPCTDEEINEEEFNKAWEHHYRNNPHHPEYATLKSPSGHLVRSKSELLIDMALFQHQLPFRYECQLLLSGIAFYPDFTIRHPKSGKTFYWEHFGMMNNLNYSKKTFEKLQIYNNHNILPDFNLITTYETTNHPLNLDVIENKIEFFFS